MLYPLQLEPIFKQRIWGGHTFEELFGCRISQNTPIGELWAVADYPSDTSLVINGFLAGKTLDQVLLQFPEELIGYCNSRNFPWLIKFLDATDKLSVQVHPDEQLAARFRGERSKAEMWYVLKAGPEAEIIYGLKSGVDRAAFLQALEQEQVVHCLNRVKVKAGDVFYIPPGLVHALGRDILVAEVQQNSDTTYRIYDYNRTDDSGKHRELHIAKALEAIDFSLHPIKTNFCIPLESKYFRVDILDITPHALTSLPDKELQALLILRGEGIILHNATQLQIRAGNAVVIPAELSGVVLQGTLQVLRCRMGAKVNSRRNNRRESRASSSAI
ncbi:MAG TPA: type I phosphomannose isomerase catalytic subunit [Candidatus Deferrimicrobium sp.]|nr:type I phosphomannose isomerase catalytic subunit [Candidatus Deferrimicrobium sp.]